MGDPAQVQQDQIHLAGYYVDVDTSDRKIQKKVSLRHFSSSEFHAENDLICFSDLTY